ncbi:hypothetical protein JOB18_036333 [Solea senegalensis]|uniref:Uncharacterized protein n=1 Tax=Solea senegalensis TaxID=28829 RepID=A0AAV6QGT8_SOLSE|nr:hypothetical protein JOB18_036333 [Solea senegalensis]
MRTKAHIDSLAENAKLMMELRGKESEWKERFEALEETMRQKLAEKDEAWVKELKLVKQEIQLCQESCLNKVEEEEEWRMREKNG